MTGKDNKTPRPPAARKAKPRDLAEAHKPSRKVALNEILRSLQDLVNNELSVVPGKSPVTPESGTAAAPDQLTPSDVPDTATGSAPAPEAADVAAVIVAESPTAPAPAPTPEPPAVIPPGGLQQELPYLEPAEPEPESARAPATPSAPDTEPAAQAVAVDSELPALEAVTGDSAAPAAPGETTAEIDDLGEIPVLEDIIDFREEAGPGAGAAAAVPPAAEARRLAIQVAARLNVELRKAGKPSLNSEVITRLARLLEEALAKAGANMENSPPEKH